MIIKQTIIPDFPDFHRELNYKPERSLFFDIETTGFSPSTCFVFLIGTLRYIDSNWQLTQYYAETSDEESAIIQEFYSQAEEPDTLIHFNGSSFDIPFLSQRGNLYQFSFPEKKTVLDLYQILRPYKKYFSLKHMNQTSLEKLTGWNRTDRLTGKHLVKLYQTYLLSKEKLIPDLLLGHNEDDVLGMTKLLPLVIYREIKQGSLIQITNIKHKSESGNDYVFFHIVLECTLPVPFSVQIPLKHGKSIQINCTLSGSENQLILRVPVIHATMKHFFPDYKNYCYLPLEDVAIHKSVATYVDNAYKIQAKASNCYIKKSGDFLPQPEAVFTPTFQSSYEEKELFFLFSEDLNDPRYQRYVCSILSLDPV